jgi:hypothetical protein
MRVNGSWCVCDDGALRPIIEGEVLNSEGTWLKVPLLVDSGADQTVFIADVLESLNCAAAAPGQLQGVGGIVGSVAVEAQVRFWRDDEHPCLIKGRFGAFADASALDMSVLGRDVTYHFALIVDRQQDVVCLLGPGHRYTIHSG